MYWSVHRHKIEYIFSDSKQILDRNNSVSSGDYSESPNEKKIKNF